MAVGVENERCRFLGLNMGLDVVSVLTGLFSCLLNTSVDTFCFDDRQHLTVVHETIVDELIFSIREWDNKLLTCVEFLCFSDSPACLFHSLVNEDFPGGVLVHTSPTE